MTTGHGEPIQKQFAFEDQEHIVGVICHDPRCLPDPSKHPQTGPRLVQRLLAGELEPGRGDANGNGRRRHASANGDGAGPACPRRLTAIALTAGGKVLRFALAPLAAVSTRKGRIVVRLDPTFKDDLVVGVEATDGSENVCLATRSARVLIFPVTEANIVAGAARGVAAIRLDAKDRVIGFVLANKKREGLTVRTNRGATQIVRATKYPVTGPRRQGLRHPPARLARRRPARRGRAGPVARRQIGEVGRQNPRGPARRSRREDQADRRMTSRRSRLECAVSGTPMSSGKLYTPNRSPSSRAWRPSAAGRACTSAASTRPGCTTCSGRSSTTRSTR